MLRKICNIIHLNLLFILILMVSPNNSTMAQQLSPEQVVQNNLDFYNKRNIDGFMSYFTDDVTIVNFSDSKIIAKDSKEVRKIYDDMFKISPNLYSTIVKRVVLGNKVIDH